MGSFVLRRKLERLIQILSGLVKSILQQVAVTDVVQQTGILWFRLKCLFVVELRHLPILLEVSNNGHTVVRRGTGRIQRERLTQDISSLLQFDRIVLSGLADFRLPSSHKFVYFAGRNRRA